MGVINSMDDIVKALTDGRAQHHSFFVDNRVGPNSGPGVYGSQLSSCWRMNKSNGANGKAPDGVTYLNGPCTRATLGAMPFKLPINDRQLVCLGFEGAMMAAGSMIMYDRLAQAGQLSTTVLTEQPAVANITRNMGGEGNEIWMEIFTQIGTTTSANAVVTYLNQNGEQKVTPPVFMGGNGLREEGRLIRFPLADGDTGVTGIVSFKMNTSSGTAGEVALVIVRPLTSAISENPASAFYRDLISGTPVLPIIDADACISFAFLGVTGSIRGAVTVHMIEV